MNQRVPVAVHSVAGKAPFVVVCADGSVWSFVDEGAGTWLQMPSIPGSIADVAKLARQSGGDAHG